MSSVATPSDAEEAVYDSARTSLLHKVLVALGAGGAFYALASFTAWGFHLGARRHGHHLVAGLAVALVLLTAALASRVVRRVGLDRATHTLRLYRDPGTVEVIPLATVARFASEPSPGGLGRDPAERLVVVLHDRRERRYALPDDADTPGIVADLEAARRDGAQTPP